MLGIPKLVTDVTTMLTYVHRDLNMPSLIDHWQTTPQSVSMSTNSSVGINKQMTSPTVEETSRKTPPVALTEAMKCSPLSASDMVSESSLDCIEFRNIKSKVAMNLFSNYQPVTSS